MNRRLRESQGVLQVVLELEYRMVIVAMHDEDARHVNDSQELVDHYSVVVSVFFGGAHRLFHRSHMGDVKAG